MRLKNNLFLGLLLGLITPLIAYFTSEIILKREIFSAKPGVPYLVSIATNLILMRFLYKANTNKTANGIAIITILVLIGTFIFKIKLR